MVVAGLRHTRPPAWVGYTDFFHLAPVYAGSLLTAMSLALSRQYLLKSS